PRRTPPVNPGGPGPALARLRAATEAAGFVLAPRLTVYPEYAQRAEEWLHPDVRTAVLVASDLEGLARDTAWAPGRDDLEPPNLLPAERTHATSGPVGEVLAGVLAG